MKWANWLALHWASEIIVTGKVLQPYFANTGTILGISATVFGFWYTSLYVEDFCHVPECKSMYAHPYSHSLHAFFSFVYAVEKFSRPSAKCGIWCTCSMWTKGCQDSSSKEGWGKSGSCECHIYIGPKVHVTCYFRSGIENPLSAPVLGWHRWFPHMGCWFAEAQNWEES